MICNYSKILLLWVLVLPGFSLLAQMNPKFKFEEALKLVQENYVDRVNDEHLVDVAIRAMIADLDPHSRYTSREEAEAMRQAMSGHFAGIGIQFLKNGDSTYVTNVTEESPAMRAGIKGGDVIVSIDGVSLVGPVLQNRDIMQMIRGEVGDTVIVSVKRPSETSMSEKKVVRQNIASRSVVSKYMVDEEIGYIALSMFTESTRTEIDEALKELIDKGMRKLILDLQGNGGGYVQSAIGVVDEFLEREKLVFYSVTNSGVKDHYYTGGFGRFYSGKIAVLIDEQTASASEIVTGALQDWDRAVVIGRRSFGKGLMQKPVEMSDGSVLQLTGARYYIPSGRSIQRPYDKGRDVYFADLGLRMVRNELLQETVMDVPDSLKYNTLTNKRVVFGGGGIIPDRFVPVDTVLYSGWMTSIMNGGLVNKISFDYVNNNRSGLLEKYPSFETFKNEYVVPSDWVDVLSKAIVEQQIVVSPTWKRDGGRFLETEIKAQMAGLLYADDDCARQVRNTVNRSFISAIEILKSSKDYKKLLHTGNDHEVE